MAHTVLVIEDSPSVRRLIGVCLRPLGVELLEAEDGAVGLRTAGERTPDIILLDIGLPGIDGWEVLRRLRHDPGLSTVPVLIVTAHAQPELAAKAEDRGADGFITKPFRPSDLRNEVSALLARDNPHARPA